MYKTDYHIHTIYSDGKSDFNEYIDKAVAEGFSEIGFSDHLSFDTKFNSVTIDLDQIPRYISELMELREKRNGIRIRIGLEIDYETGAEEQIHDLTRSLPLDYLIGSVHYLDYGSVDMTPDFYRDKDIYFIWEEYFRLVEKAVESGLFDILGHPDLVRIFRFFPPSDFSHLYKSLTKKLKEYDMAFEVNTNGFNKHIGDFYPDRNFLKLFHDEGIPVCVNSDAHNPRNVGQHFDVAYNELRKTGYRELAIFEKRKRSATAL